ncbi:drebrin-like protein [Microdochium nivale]|nr:drebrin-like protein [Microdochium nivale]
MASLNLSANGPSIKNSYSAVVSSDPAPADSSSTFAQWALFAVQAPLANAFQDSTGMESVLKVQTTGEGELLELIEDFNDGRIQFAFVKVKDPNSGLPKFALIAWCGGGVPERTKGYFTSHLNAVSKVLHGYHVQITARSDADLDPAKIIQKVSDASGAKYTAGGSAPVKSGGPPPPIKSKPVFASASSSSVSFNPLVAARNAGLKSKNDDGWGDAPEVTRSEVQKVESAYKPTKVNMNELRGQQQPAPKFTPSRQEDVPEVVKGAYQPVGKVDIAAIRAAAREKQDDRPTTVKGAYEPVGKVDIAAIRAQAQKPSKPDTQPIAQPNAQPAHQPDAAPEAEPEADERPRSLAERSRAFSQSERISELPKPKVTKKWTGPSSVMGTKPLTPGVLGLAGPVSPAAAAPVGSASRTFADQNGKTPAQLWAEKKAAQREPVTPPPGSPSQVTAQTSGSGAAGGWQSGYAGKSWAPVQPSAYARGIAGQKTGDSAADPDQAAPVQSEHAGSVRDRLKEAAPFAAAAGVGAAAIGVGASYAANEQEEEEDRGPPPPPMGARPPVEERSSGAPAGGFALPGMPPRPPPPAAEEEEEELEPSSPIRVAAPVPRVPEPEMEPVEEPRVALPTRTLEQAVPREEELEAEEDIYDPRAASQSAAEEQFGTAPSGSNGTKRALIQYDYERAEENELELREGEYVTNIDMVDDDWWMGTNGRGEVGLFPSNYVELVDDVDDTPPEPPAASRPPPRAAPAAEPEAAPAQAAASGATATAEFDYEAAEDNELSFPEGATVTNVEFPDEDWWFGHYKGDSGLFPANYVKLNQ